MTICFVLLKECHIQGELCHITRLITTSNRDNNKGSTLCFLNVQGLVGGSKPFEAFLKAYLQHFKFRTLTTADFKQFFCDYFKDTDAIQQIDWQTWLYSPGTLCLAPLQSCACKCARKPVHSTSNQLTWRIHPEPCSKSQIGMSSDWQCSCYTFASATRCEALCICYICLLKLSLSVNPSV